MSDIGEHMSNSGDRVIWANDVESAIWSGPVVYGTMVLSRDELSKLTSLTQLETLLSAKAHNLQQSLLRHAIDDGLCHGLSISKELQ